MRRNPFFGDPFDEELAMDPRAVRLDRLNAGAALLKVHDASVLDSIIGAARAAMARQTVLDKKTVINIRPAYLLVPAALELAAEQIIAQNLVPAKTGDVVPSSIRTLTPIAEPRLDVASATASAILAEQEEACLVGVFDLKKTASQAWSVGDKIWTPPESP